MESFFVVAIIIFSFSALISYFWVQGIDHMQKNHPDYKADDFLNWNEDVENEDDKYRIM
jgi:hypothetical protein